MILSNSRFAKNKLYGVFCYLFSCRYTYKLTCGCGIKIDSKINKAPLRISTFYKIYLGQNICNIDLCIPSYLTGPPITVVYLQTIILSTYLQFPVFLIPENAIFLKLIKSAKLFCFNTKITYNYLANTCKL